MTQTLTKNIVALAIATALFSILLTMPQASEARSIRAERNEVGEEMRGRNASTTATSSRSEVEDKLKDRKDRIMASSTASSTRPTKNLSCVQGAVEVRETAIIASWTKFHTAASTGLTMRKDALVDAWKITDPKERAVALKDLWKNWKEASKKAHAALKVDRKAAWAGFQQTMKTECREARLPKEDTEPKDASGAITL